MASTACARLSSSPSCWPRAVASFSGAGRRSTASRSVRPSRRRPDREETLMTIHAKIAGWSGIVAGLGLAVEGALWTLSGWTADTFTDPASAIDFLREDGAMLRAAVFVGLLNLVFAVVFVAGLAGRIRGRAPIAAAATLWFGMIGIALHLIVPFGHWYGVPAFVDAADRDATAAQSAWTAFTVVLDAAGGAAN